MPLVFEKAPLPRYISPSRCMSLGNSMKEKDMRRLLSEGRRVGTKEEKDD